MLKILVLSVGTNACYHFVKTIKENFKEQIYVVGVDINPLHLVPTCNFIDKFFQVPLTSDSSYYKTILEICKTEKIDYLLPSFDADQKLFYPENQDLLSINVRSLGTSIDTLPIYDNKIKMTEYLRENNIPVPIIYDVVDDNAEYFIKPKNGVASIGARKVKGTVIKGLHNRNDFIIQEVCCEPEITLECFYFNNQLATVARERIASKAGVCVKTRIYNDESLHAIAEKFVSCVKTPICFNLQFMRNCVGEFVITDVNLRFAGGMSLSYAVGWDEATALGNILIGKSSGEVFCYVKPIIGTKYVVRAYADIVTKEEKEVVVFDLDGTLLDSRKRHRVLLDKLLSDEGIEIDTSDLLRFKRNGKNNYDYLISKGIDKVLAEKIQASWISNIENKEYLKIDGLYSYSKNLLEEYSGYKLVLLTARSNKGNALEQIKELGLEKYFAEIIVVPNGKFVAEEKASVLKDKQAILMIGDTKSDFKATQIAGIKFKHMNEGFHEVKYVFY